MNSINNAKIILYILFLVFFIFSCSNSNQSELERSLNFAKGNRVQLEMVINHYSSNPADSLKLKAAYYLIENMQYYYTIKSKKLDSYKSEIYLLSIDNNWLPMKTYEFLERKYGKLFFYDYDKIYDSHVITSEYLIRNIEQSFNIWHKQPWGKYISFDSFCEEILPYRIGNEPLEYWKDKYYEYLNNILDSLPKKNDPIEVYKFVIEKLFEKKWLFTQDLHMPHLGATYLLENRIGYCRDMCDFGKYIMRALGISGGTDFIIQHADDMYGEHLWNYLTDTLGNCIDIDMINVKEKFLRPRKKGRVYRQLFAKESGDIRSYYDNKIPLAYLNNPFMKDVSDLYFPNNEIVISTTGYNIKNNLVYLGVFNNKKWIPIIGNRISDNQVCFHYLDTAVMYMPLYYDKNEFLPFKGAFNIKSNDSIFFPRANNKILQDMVLSRKHKIPYWWIQYGNRCLNGRFQGANNPDFSDVQDLYVINHLITMDYYYITIESRKKFQYVRYLSGLNGYNNMAEIAFYGGDKLKKLTGVIIGTEGSFNNISERTKNAVFDNDPITFYDANEKNGAWVGLKFDIPQSINMIMFLFRNDDNNIRIGDHYELFYLDNNCQWISMGKVIAKDTKLIYHNVPANGLYILRNHTRGKEERIFTYENGCQVWW